MHLFAIGVSRGVVLGVFPRMSRLYQELEEMKAAMNTLRSLLTLGMMTRVACGVPVEADTW